MITQEQLKELLHYNPETGVFRWKVALGRARTGSVAGCINSIGYRQIRINGVRYLAHRLAWLYTKEEWPEKEIDHINRVRDDNRISNLRFAEAWQNKANAEHQIAKSGFRGVDKNGNRYRAQIKHKGEGILIGYFNTPQEAHEAYVKKAKELKGEFSFY